MENCATIGTPINEETNLTDDADLLDADGAKKYRGATALILYMSQDRADLSVAATFLAKGMVSPTDAGQRAVKRAVRYITRVPRVATLYRWSDSSSHWHLYTDSDWKSTRRSHSGGLLLLGYHVPQHWCRMQDSLALSSGEAELYSSSRGLANLLSLWNLAREMRNADWGTATLYLDASACKSILLRKGAGTMKHLEIKDLWGQRGPREEH